MTHVSQQKYIANGYEDAVSTKLLATHCMACSRPLRDPESVEAGIGPICREKYGYDIAGGPVDEALVEKALAYAPEVMRRALSPTFRRGDLKRVASQAVHHAAMAVSYSGPQSEKVIAVAQQIIQGCGYPMLSDRVKAFHFRSMISLERTDRNMVCANTPYNGSFLSAVKQIPGRRWTGSMWCVPEDKLDHLVAALSQAFPEQIMQDLDGNLVAIPRDVQFPPPKTRPAGSPDEQTGETQIDDKLADLKKGDYVLDPSGKERKIGWIDHTKGRLGLVQQGVRGYEFFAIDEMKLIPPKELEQRQGKQYGQDVAEATSAGAPVPPPPPPTRDIPETAFPYQIEGISWLDQKRSGLLADEPGLGKTLQACVVTDPLAVVVCPAAMRVEWVRELNKWRPDLSVMLLTGRKKMKAADYKSADVLVINYDILGSIKKDGSTTGHLAELVNLDIRTLIADEAHMLKTLKLSRKQYVGSSRAKAFVHLTQKADRIILLTATPIMNRPIELWPLLHMIDAERWDSYSGFGKRFCDGRLEEKVVRGGRVQRMWNFTGSSNERELNAILTSQYMLRRTKDVLDLPEKSRQSRHIALDAKTAKEYDKAAREFLKWVEDQGGAEAVEKAKMAQALTKMTKLRHLAAVGKVDYAVEWIANHFEATGRPLVVMAHHRDVTQGIVERLQVDEKGEPVVVEGPDGPRQLRVGKIIGGMSEKQRTADKDAFQAGQLDVIVCSIQAAGVGLTLTAASETLFVERAWRPADLVQAEDRIYRIGQTNKCTITYLDAANTIDEAIATLLIDKRETFAKVIDGKDVDQDEAAELVLGVMFGLTGEAGAKMPRRGLTENMARQNPDQGTFDPLVPWMGASDI